MGNPSEGIIASPGIAIGRVRILEERDFAVTVKHDINVAAELARFQSAVDKSEKELLQIQQETKEQFGEEHAQIFAAHLLVLKDPELFDSVKSTITSEKINAEAALERVTKGIVGIFEAMDDEYMSGRSADIEDVSQRVMSHLFGKTMSLHSGDGDQVILVAHDLTPSDTVQLHGKSIGAFITDLGGRTSHTAIMARSMGIPAIVGLKDITKRAVDGEVIIVDGNLGHIIMNPSTEELSAYQQKRSDFLKQKQQLSELVHEPTMTVDGHRVELAANIGTPNDLTSVIENGAEGIGLFRSEFLYMNRDSLPTEEQQFQAYKKVAETMQGKPVVIRTLDIGGDKEVPYLNLEPELNPFLGYRAIRICLDRKELFKTQLRAILRASAYGQVKIMYPMISNITEVRQANHVLEEARSELLQEGIAFNPNLEVGIMVEIPACALAASVIAKEVDFFSIGTNDLTQYTMACDRLNEKVSYLYQPYHPSILQLIQLVVSAGHKEGKWVGMCGELAGDLIAIPILLGLGLDEFSMSSSSILPARNLIRTTSLSDMQIIANEALTLSTSEEIRDLVVNRMNPLKQV